MRISVENIGKIGKATIDINGITVIAGENNTGKSTIGRALFSIFNSFHNIDQLIEDDRAKSVYEALGSISRRTRPNFRTLIELSDCYSLAQRFVAEIDKYKNDKELIKQEILACITRTNENNENNTQQLINETVLHISEIINISDEDIFKNVLERRTSAEFNEQIVNIFSGGTGKLKLEIQGNPLSVTFASSGEVVSIKNGMNLSLRTEAVYIDDPFIIDELGAPEIGLIFYYTAHRHSLKEKLSSNSNDTNFVDAIIAENRLKNIFDKISSVCNGNIIRNKPFGYAYKLMNSDNFLDVKNLSTGLKTFAIIKTLLINKELDFGGTLILDEPEIHLHPEWQLIFAEIIVLLQKEFNMHILLNTHSPYFLEAIEVYSKRHNIEDRCKYYLATSVDNIATFEDATDNIEIIYQKLAKPFQDLENERYADD